MTEIDRQEFERLEKRVAELEERVQSTDHSAMTSELDHYDKKFLRGFENGQSVSLTALKKQARKIGLTQEKTIKKRLRRLEEIGYLEDAGMSKWVVQK